MPTTLFFHMAELAAPARTFTHRMSMVARIRDIAAHHELLLNLIRLELKAKYKASALGFAWSLLNPALYLVVFYVAFDVILGSGIPRFPIYLLSGLLVWNFFTSALNGGTGAVVAGSGLVKKVWFPREVLPLASVGAALVHFFLQMLVLLGAVALLRHPVGWAEMTLVPLALLDLVLLAAGLALLFSVANVYLRDMAHFVELALLAWFWLTPIVYPFTQLGDALGGRTDLALLNPVTPVVVAFQGAFYGNFGDPKPVIPPNLDFIWHLRNLGIVLVGALLVLALALRVFSRLEGNLAEEL
ncbi:MAG TPA: ABC transporter permease [Acidimicrobiia bacterium]|nr:ABC transporter permease [Acidimicrobiia bacterium]